jgi:hypothetical protein
VANEQIAWRKSSFCANTACVEIAFSGREVLMRDSKDACGAVLRFSTDEWTEFTDGIAAGEFLVE